MKRVKKIGIPVLSVLGVILLFAGLQRLVEPKYDGRDDMPLEGNFTAEYYQETTDHDVLMVGDCEVYENIDTMYLWKNYGITSYIRGNAQQLVWQSYYMLEDTLRHEKPKVVIYNVQSLEHAEPQRETYNRMTLDGMKWSKTKWNAIRASLCQGENMVEYVLPFFRYHSRILSLTKSDLEYYWHPKKVAHNGYYMRIDVLPASESDVADTAWLLGDAQENGGSDASSEGEEDLWALMEAEEAETDDGSGVSSAEETETEDNSEASSEEEIETGDDREESSDEGEDLWALMEEEEAVPEEAVSDEQDGTTDTTEPADPGKKFASYPMQYLDKMRKLCKEQGIQLILMKAPSLSPVWYDSENQQILDYAAKYDLPYINFYDLLEETGIDYETDTYDGGLHLNRSGAGKLSGYLGKVLTEQYGVSDHRQDSQISKVYEKKYQFYEDMIQAQQDELDRYGEIRNY